MANNKKCFIALIIKKETQYCSGNTEAHVGQDPVFISSRDELIALVGKLAYDELVVHCEARVQMLDRATGTLRIGMAPHLADPV